MSTNGYYDAADSLLKARVKTVNGIATPQDLSSNGHVNKASNGYFTATTEDEAGRLLRRVLDLVLEAKLVTGLDASEKVVHFRHPHELEVSPVAYDMPRTTHSLLVSCTFFITLTYKI